MRKIIPYLDDVFYWLGASLMAGFSWFVYKPAPLLVMGVFCLIFAFLFARAARQQMAQKKDDEDAQP